MRILLLAKDLYATVGGGETVYRKIIAAHPGIDFVYLRDLEAAHAPRPANAACVALRAPRALRAAPPLASALRLARLQEADAYARSVAGQEFDAIELPDYAYFGTALRDALALNRVAYRALVLAMHGNFSKSVELAWDGDRALAREMAQLEHEQFVDADARYALSKRYAAEWQARAAAEIHLLDPLAIAGAPAPLELAAGAARPSLYCIGRMERRKGNDLFVELVRWLDPSLYEAAYHVGNRDHSRSGRSSEALLRELAAARGARIDFLPSQDRPGLKAIFARASFVVLPVRYDAFNFVALEALLRGCPTAVSNGAGACDFLDEELPEVPYVKIDLGNPYAALDDLRAVLADYPAYRRRLGASLRALRCSPKPLDMTAFYAQAIRRGARRADAVRPAARLATGRPLAWRALAQRLRRISPRTARRLQSFAGAVEGAWRRPREVLLPPLRRSAAFNDAVFVGRLLGSFGLRGAQQRIARMPEDGAPALQAKLRALHDLASQPVRRFAAWRELARLERMRGDEVVAAAYEIRLMRLGAPRALELLPATLASLERHGYAREAQALRAMAEPGAQADERVYDYLRTAFERNRSSEPRPWQVLDDRRSGEPRVSVIVSLYDAAPKLALFLTCLAQQTLVRRGEVEVILVDSASPADERRVVEEFVARRPLSLVYGRSQERETIQAAWNRGIHLARAPYLVFLGADETLYPEALEALAGELDENPAVDWVMADSLVTDTDQHGVFARDVMAYRRGGATKDHAYLETCYLSWVGGMYRKSIHERFGYYDESFRGAGDTEFKNRVLPYLNLRFVPRTLGLFLNYPDARVTASAAVEIEDLRAWYLHRTPGGVRYAFERRSPQEALRLFYAALGYRKSYRRHTSCDLDYARHLLDYVIRSGARPDLAPVRDELDRLIEAYRAIERDAPPAGALALARLRFGATQRKHARRFRGAAAPAYKIFNDNRYEQHHWPWRSLAPGEPDGERF